MATVGPSDPERVVMMLIGRKGEGEYQSQEMTKNQSLKTKANWSCRKILNGS